MSSVNRPNKCLGFVRMYAIIVRSKLVGSEYSEATSLLVCVLATPFQIRV